MMMLLFTACGPQDTGKNSPEQKPEEPATTSNSQTAEASPSKNKTIDTPIHYL